MVMTDSAEVQVETLAFLEPDWGAGDVGRLYGEVSLQLAMPLGQISKAEGGRSRDTDNQSLQCLENCSD